MYFCLQKGYAVHFDKLAKLYWTCSATSLWNKMNLLQDDHYLRDIEWEDLKSLLGEATSSLSPLIWKQPMVTNLKVQWKAGTSSR